MPARRFTPMQTRRTIPRWAFPTGAAPTVTPWFQSPLPGFRQSSVFRRGLYRFQGRLHLRIALRAHLIAFVHAASLSNNFLFQARRDPNALAAPVANAGLNVAAGEIDFEIVQKIWRYFKGSGERRMLR